MNSQLKEVLPPINEVKQAGINLKENMKMAVY